MKALPDGLDTDAIAPTLLASWGIGAETIEYAPLGFGSYHWIATDPHGTRHFVTVDDLDRKPWLGSDRETVFAGLTSAFAAAAQLREVHRLEFVVAPIRGPDAQILRRLDARHTMAVFPYADGRSGGFGEYSDDADRAEVLGTLAALHRVSSPPGGLRVDVLLPGRERLEEALVDRQGWVGGPYSDPARRWLNTHARSVRAALDRLDLLAPIVGAREHVITHGEPHPGNVIRAAQGVLLIDWDTVALAPAERDLWHVATTEGDKLAAYVEATGRTVDPAVLTAYRIAWDLADVAAYLDLFRSPHQDDADSALAWSSLDATHLDQLSPGQDN